MAKRLTFEEIFGKEFRWPKAGDDPFDVHDGDGSHAKLSEDDFSRFVFMKKGYFRSAEALVDIALENWMEKDMLVYPILFLYRHALEINLKYIINFYGRHVEVEPVWDTHDFEKLWPSFLQVLDRFGTDDPDRADQYVGAIIAQFGKVDPRSFSYRYPCDRTGTPIPLVQKRMDLENLKDVMEGIFSYFIGVDAYLDNMINS